MLSSFCHILHVVSLRAFCSELLDIWLFEGLHSLVLKLFQTQNMWLRVEHLFPRAGAADPRGSAEGMIADTGYN